DVSIVDVEAERMLPTEEDIQGVHAKHILRPSWFVPTHFKPWFLVKAMHMIISSAIRLAQARADIYHAHDAHALPACYIAACLHQYLGLEPEVRIALYQGYLQPDRGLDRLVHAAEFLEPNTIIVMMGKAVPTTQAHLEALIASKRVADRVKIIPAVPYAELLD